MKYEEKEFQQLKEKVAEFMTGGPFKDMFARYRESSMYQFRDLEDMLEKLRLQDVRKELLEYLYKISYGKKRETVWQTEELVNDLWLYGCPDRDFGRSLMEKLAWDVCKMAESIDYWEWEKMRRNGESKVDVARRLALEMQISQKRYELMKHWHAYQEDIPLEYEKKVQVAEVVVKLEATIKEFSRIDITEERILAESKKFLKETEYADAVIHFVLKREEKGKLQYEGFAVGGRDTALYFDLTKRRYEEEFLDESSTDHDLFACLEDGYEIAVMTAEGHSGVWYEVEDMEKDSIIHKEGMKTYIEFCRKNHISASMLTAAVGWKQPDLLRAEEKSAENRETSIGNAGGGKTR